MKDLSERIKMLSPSQTVEMNQKSQDLQSQGIDVVNLSVGQPDFYTPDHIKKAAKTAIDENYSFYSPVAGYNDLREAVSEKLRSDFRSDVFPPGSSDPRKSK